MKDKVICEKMDKCPLFNGFDLMDLNVIILLRIIILTIVILLRIVYVVVVEV